MEETTMIPRSRWRSPDDCSPPYELVRVRRRERRRWINWPTGSELKLDLLILAGVILIAGIAIGRL